MMEQEKNDLLIQVTA